MAVDQEQADRLAGLYERGLKNQVPELKMIERDEIKKIEPNCVVRIKLILFVSQVEIFNRCTKQGPQSYPFAANRHY